MTHFLALDDSLSYPKVFSLFLSDLTPAWGQQVEKALPPLPEFPIPSLRN